MPLGAENHISYPISPEGPSSVFRQSSISHASVMHILALSLTDRLFTSHFTLDPRPSTLNPSTLGEKRKKDGRGKGMKIREGKIANQEIESSRHVHFWIQQGMETLRRSSPHDHDKY